MPKTDYKKLYSDLNNLLNEISVFLTDEIKEGKFSSKAQEIANSLIKRTNVQLAVIADVQKDTTPEEKNNEKDNTVKCPFEDLPTKNLKTGEKKGFIYRREQKSCFFKKYRRLYAGIHETWLLLYRSEKDIKPFEGIYLGEFDIQNCPEDSQLIKDRKKRETTFELIQDKNVVHQFIATTAKDREQWISNISRKRKQTDAETETIKTSKIEHSKTYISRRSLPKIPDTTDSYVNMETPIPGGQKELKLLPESNASPGLKSSPSPFKRPVPQIPTEDDDDEDEGEEIYDAPMFPNSPPADTISNCSETSEGYYDLPEPKKMEPNARVLPHPDEGTDEDEDKDETYDIPDISVSPLKLSMDVKQTTPIQKPIILSPAANNLAKDLKSHLEKRLNAGLTKPKLPDKKPILKAQNDNQKDGANMSRTDSKVKRLMSQFNKKT